MNNTFHAVKARRLVGNDDVTEGQPGWPCWVVCRSDGTFMWGTYGHYDRLWDDAKDYFVFQGVDVDDDEAVEKFWERHRFVPKFVGEVGVDVHSHWTAQYRHSWMIDYEKTEVNDPNQHTNRYDVFLAPYADPVHKDRFNAFISIIKFTSDSKMLNPRPAVYECGTCHNMLRLATRGPIPLRCPVCR